ncbi:MAG TPA: DUF1902 domain-containing protein [Allosphingosinicella sp.]
MKLERVARKRHVRKQRKPSFTTSKRIFESIQRGLRRMGAHVVQPIELKVHLAYDDEADVWYVAQSDVPGLCLEAATAPALVERVMQIAPELIELNEDELLKKYVRRERTSVAVTPVFDSPLRLAHA